MVDVVVHFRGKTPQEATLPALPVVGAYLDGDGGLFVVSGLVLRGDTWHVFAAGVGPERAAALRAEWQGWQDVPAVAPGEPAKRQKGLFQNE